MLIFRRCRVSVWVSLGWRSNAEDRLDLWSHCSALLLWRCVRAGSGRRASRRGGGRAAAVPSAPPKGYECHDKALSGSGPGFKSSQEESEEAALADWLAKAQAIYADADWKTTKDPRMECVKQGLYSKCFATRRAVSSKDRSDASSVRELRVTGNAVEWTAILTGGSPTHRWNDALFPPMRRAIVSARRESNRAYCAQLCLTRPRLPNSDLA